MDNESFVSQLAQFSSLESMQSVDNSMQTMAEGMKSDRFLLGANLLGTNINVPGQYSELMEGSYISGKAKVSGNFESLDFVVSNSDGKVVYEQRLENVLPGDLSLMWNGKDLTGEQQPSGKYSLKLTATDNGKQTNIPVSTSQTISSVKWNEAKNEVLVEISDGRTFSLQSLEQFNI
jgi:flagellar basal-body rod modification protein FlgD